MKKKYEKLYVRVEKFDVIQSISSCNVSVTLSGGSGCAEPDQLENPDLFALYWEFPEVFTNTCTDDFNELGYLGYCYHTPTGGATVLTS